MKVQNMVSLFHVANSMCCKMIGTENMEAVNVLPEPSASGNYKSKTLFILSLVN